MPSPASSSCACGPGAALPGDADLVILPGSKATIADLAALRARRLGHRHRGASCAAAAGCSACAAATRCSAAPSPIPDGIEGPAGDGRRARPARCRDRAVAATSGSSRCTARPRDGVPFAGYEMHIGVTEGPDRARPFARLADGRPEGAVSADGRVVGTYIHGLFADDRQRAAWLARLGGGHADRRLRRTGRATLDALAAHLEAHHRSRPAAQPGAMTTRGAARATSAISSASARAIERERARGYRPPSRRGGRRPSTASSTARRRRCAGPRARGPARRPSRLPASRHWASGAAARRAAPRARPPPPTRRRVSAAAATISSARQPRRRQVDEIVEPRRRPAEGVVARRAMADHAVGGVDRLVERARRAGRRARARTPARRRRRRNSRPGSRSRRGRRRPRRALRDRGRRCARPRARPASRPSRFERGGDRATCWCRLRCAISALASERRRATRPNGSREQLAFERRSAIAADDARRGSGPRRCRARRARARGIRRLAIERAVEPRSGAPIQVTGWPIARTSRPDSRRRPRSAAPERASATDMIPSPAADEPLPHGGDLGAARRLFPGAPEPFIDLSTGINPHPYPVPPLPPELFARLPEPPRLDRLAAAAARPMARRRRRTSWRRRARRSCCRWSRAGAAGPRRDPGADLCRACARARRSPGISVAEVARHRRAARRRPRRRRQSEQSRRPARRRETICSRSPRLRGAADCWWSTRPSWMSARRARASPAMSGAATSWCCARSANFLALPACAGLRARRAALAARLAAALGPWAVSGPALAIGEAALAGRGVVERCGSGLARRRDGSMRMLDRRGPRHRGRHVAVPAGAHAAARRLFDHLGRAGILVRRFADTPAWLRFGLPAGEEEWQRLQAAMDNSRRDGRPAHDARTMAQFHTSPRSARPDLTSLSGAAARLLVWRRDVRRFRRDPLPAGTLEALIELACLAPSVGLSEPWRFVIVDDAAAPRRGSSGISRPAMPQALAAQSASAAALCAAQARRLEQGAMPSGGIRRSRDRQGHGLGRHTMPEMIEYSVVTAVHTIWLAARAKGIGMGWVSILDPAAVARDARCSPTGNSSAISASDIRKPTTQCLNGASGWERRRLPSSVILRR